MWTRRLLPLALLCAAPLAAAAQDAKAVVAVLPFEATSLGSAADPAALGRTLGDMIMAAMSTRPIVRMVERQQVDDLVKKRQLALSGRVSEEQAMELGQLLGADYVIYGSVLLTRDEANLNMRIVDAETGETHKAASRRGKQDKFLDLVEQLAEEFTTGLKVPQKVRVAEAATPVDAVLAYSRGLDYERRGRKGDAKTMYSKALEIFPEFRDAKTALDRVN